MGDVGKIFNRQKFNSEGDGIYAFKPQPDRFLCFFFTGKRIIVTNGFRKKSQKLPTREKEKAQRAYREYTGRVKSGDYYG
jgi:phage-related protein